MPVIADLIVTLGRAAIPAIVEKLRKRKQPMTAVEAKAAKTEPDAASMNTLQAISDSDDVALTGVKPATKDSINWTQFIGPACSVLAIFGLNLKPDEIVAVVAGIQAAQAIVTVIIRTFFTHTVISSAANRAADQGKVV